MAPGLVFLIAVVLSGVVSDRSARILNQSETPNDIKHGTRNISVVLGTDVSACNSTQCEVSKVRRVRLKFARNFTASAGRRNDFLRQPNRGLLPPFRSGSDIGDDSRDYSYQKPQQDMPPRNYAYPEPQEDNSGYKYPKPQQDYNTDGYVYPKPKPQEDELTSGYSYPKPKPQQDEPTGGYSYPKPQPQQDSLSNGYPYPKPKPQQDMPSGGYSYPRPEPQQDELSNGYSYPKPKPPQDEPTDGYTYPKPSPEQDTLTSGYSYPKPQLDEPSDGYSYPKPNPHEDEVNVAYSYSKSQLSPADGILDDYQQPFQPGSNNRLVLKKRVKSWASVPSWDYSTQANINSWKPMSSRDVNRQPTQPTTSPPQTGEESIEIPVPLSDTPQQNTPETELVPPGRDESLWNFYFPPLEGSLGNAYGPPQNDPLPPKPSYGPSTRPTRPPQTDPADSYLPPQNDPLPPIPTYGPPSRPTRPPQNDPADSYLPPQNDPVKPKPTYGVPTRPTRPPQNDPADSYLPPQNDPLPPIPTYGPPSRPTRPPQNDPADSYLPPQNDPVKPKPTYGVPTRPTRPPQNDPADSYLPPQNDPVKPKPTYGVPTRPTRPPQNDPADSYLPPQNDPLPPKPTYGVPARPTRPPLNDQPPNPVYGLPSNPPLKDPVNSYLPPEGKPPQQSYGLPQEVTMPPAVEDTPSTPFWPEVEDNRSFRGSNGEYLSPPSIGAPSGSFDDPPMPVYVPYHIQDETDASRQVSNPHDGNRSNQNRVLRVPGGLQPSDIHVTDLRCWRSAPSSVFTFTLWTTKKMASSPVLIAAESSSACRLRADTSAPRSRYLVRLTHTDLARCGVRPCTNNGEDRMCVTLQLPQLTGIRLASDPQLEVSCVPPPQSDWSIKQLRMAAAAPPLGPPELRVKGGRSPLHTQLILYRRTAPGGAWRKIESSQSVVLGEELQLRALVRGGDGWQSSRLGDVIVRRTNTGEDLKSTVGLSDSTSAISARLVTPEGCPNPDMEDVTALQSWLAGDPLVSSLPIRVFMFRGQKDGEQIVISARVTACQDRLLCKMEPRQCEAANAATRVKRSTFNEDLQNNGTTTSEAEISLRVILPKSGLGTERDSVPHSFANSKLVLYVVSPTVIAILIVLGCYLQLRNHRI